MKFIYRAFIYLYFILSIISCASGYKINTKYCHSEGNWSYQLSSKEEIFKVSGFGVNEVSIRDLLKSKNINCKKVKDLSVKIKRTGKQSILSIIPNYSSWNVHIRYR